MKQAQTIVLHTIGHVIYIQDIAKHCMREMIDESCFYGRAEHMFTLLLTHGSVHGSVFTKIYAVHGFKSDI